MAAPGGARRDDGASCHTIGVFDKLAAASASRRDEDAGDKKVVAPSAWKTTAPGWAGVDASRLLAEGGMKRRAAAELLGAYGEGGNVKAAGEAGDVSVALLAWRLAWRGAVEGMGPAENVEAWGVGAAAWEGMKLGSSAAAVGNGEGEICAGNEGTRVNVLGTVGTSGLRTAEADIVEVSSETADAFENRTAAAGVGDGKGKGDSAVEETAREMAGGAAAREGPTKSGAAAERVAPAGKLGRETAEGAATAAADDEAERKDGKTVWKMAVEEAEVAGRARTSNGGVCARVTPLATGKDGARELVA